MNQKAAVVIFLKDPVRRGDARMSVQHLGVPHAAATPLIRPAYFAWAALAIGAMFGAIVSENIRLLHFAHVMSGVLWTGIDLFMGFVMGPILRRLPLEARRAIIIGLVPRTLILMPVLSLLTATTGWFLAKRMGYLEIAYPEFLWVVASLVIVTVLTVQGLGILLPSNLRIYFEIQRPQIDDEKIGRWMRRYVHVVASQGALQVAIIVVMSRFATGL
jgi:hypothetical protein